MYKKIMKCFLLFCIIFISGCSKENKTENSSSVVQDDINVASISEKSYFNINEMDIMYIFSENKVLVSKWIEKDLNIIEYDINDSTERVIGIIPEVYGHSDKYVIKDNIYYKNFVLNNQAIALYAIDLNNLTLEFCYSNNEAAPSPMCSLFSVDNTIVTLKLKKIRTKLIIDYPILKCTTYQIKQ